MLAKSIKKDFCFKRWTRIFKTVSTLVGHENPSGASGASPCWLTVSPGTGLWGVWFISKEV